MMLEQVLQYLNNWFVCETARGEFTIENGEICVNFLHPGQFFRVSGSVFNDGLHQHLSGDMLISETFSGAVSALAVPRGLVTLADEIEAWTAKNGEAGAYTSESFGGYSYTKATNSRGVAAGWRDVFAAQLAPWKKPAGSWQYANPNPHMTPPEPHKDNPWR